MAALRSGDGDGGFVVGTAGLRATWPKSDLLVGGAVAGNTGAAEVGTGGGFGAVLGEGGLGASAGF